MIHAYNEMYLDDAKEQLGDYFDCGIYDGGFTSEQLTAFFVSSGIAAQFERGNPFYISGMSGYELLYTVVNTVYAERKELPEPTYRQGYSPEYWAGWALAHYQWYYGRRFQDIFKRIPFADIVAMYSPYHEMDITRFLTDFEERYQSAIKECRLKWFRQNRNISREELAKRSEVALRDIQRFEQDKRALDNAPAKIVYKLSRVLWCDVEDLLEDPLI